MPPIALEQLAHRLTGPAPVQSSSSYAGAVDDTVRLHMRRVAERTLTAQQFAIFIRHAEGMSPTDIARALGKKAPNVHAAINGAAARASSPRGEQGIMRKMAKALVDDPPFMAAAMDSLAGPSQAPLAEWFRPSVASPAAFGPLAVLFVVSQAADVKRQVRFDALVPLAPRSALEAGLHWLRGAGFVSFDGITVTVLRTPIDPRADEDARV